MVSFTVDGQADLRLARDLQWVSRQKYPHLAEQLKAGSSSVAGLCAPQGTLFNSDALSQRIRVLKLMRWLEARGYKTVLLSPTMQLA